MAEGDPSEEEEEVHASSSEQPSGGRRSKGRKGKKSNKSGGGGRDKKRRSKENLNEIASIANSADSQREEKVLGVFIHYSDCLNLDVHLWHPIIKVTALHPQYTCILLVVLLLSYRLPSLY